MALFSITTLNSLDRTLSHVQQVQEFLVHPPGTIIYRA
jgi:hypothetical protein